MQRKRHSAEQIIRKLREAEVEFAHGASIADVCKKLGVSETTFSRWRAQFGSMTTDDVRRLKDLEKENQRLRGDPVEGAGHLPLSSSWRRRVKVVAAGPCQCARRMSDERIPTPSVEKSRKNPS